jgi:hypothetical protein
LVRNQREIVVLTLPHDPRLARLTRLVTLHFLVQNGIRAGRARRGARDVERLCHILLKHASRRRDRPIDPPLILTLSSKSRTLEVSGRQGPGGARSSLVRLERPASA